MAANTDGRCEIVGLHGVKLLMSVHDIDGIIDIERDAARRDRVACAIEVDHGVTHADHVAQIGVAVRQPSAGQFAARIGP